MFVLVCVVFFTCFLSLRCLLSLAIAGLVPSATHLFSFFYYACENKQKDVYWATQKRMAIFFITSWGRVLSFLLQNWLATCSSCFFYFVLHKCGNNCRRRRSLLLGYFYRLQFFPVLFALFLFSSAIERPKCPFNICELFAQSFFSLPLLAYALSEFSSIGCFTCSDRRRCEKKSVIADTATCSLFGDNRWEKHPTTADAL